MTSSFGGVILFVIFVVLQGQQAEVTPLEYILHPTLYCCVACLNPSGRGQINFTYFHLAIAW